MFIVFLHLTGFFRYPEFSEMYPKQKRMLNLSQNQFDSEPNSTTFPGIDGPVPSENPRRNMRLCGWPMGLYWLPPFWRRA